MFLPSDDCWGHSSLSSTLPSFLPVWYLVSPQNWLSSYNKSPFVYTYLRTQLMGQQKIHLALGFLQTSSLAGSQNHQDNWNPISSPSFPGQHPHDSSTASFLIAMCDHKRIPNICGEASQEMSPGGFWRKCSQEESLRVLAKEGEQIAFQLTPWGTAGEGYLGLRCAPLSGQSLGACFKYQLGVRRGRTGEGFVSGHFDLIPVQQWAECKHSPQEELQGMGVKRLDCWR